MAALGGSCAGGVDDERGAVDLAVDLEVQVQQVAARGGQLGGESDLGPGHLARGRLVTFGVDVEEGQVAFAQRDEVAERPR